MLVTAHTAGKPSQFILGKISPSRAQFLYQHQVFPPQRLARRDKGKPCARRTKRLKSRKGNTFGHVSQEFLCATQSQKHSYHHKIISNKRELSSVTSAGEEGEGAMQSFLQYSGVPEQKEVERIEYETFSTPTTSVIWKMNFTAPTQVLQQKFGVDPRNRCRQKYEPISVV